MRFASCVFLLIATTAVAGGDAPSVGACNEAAIEVSPHNPDWLRLSVNLVPSAPAPLWMLVGPLGGATIIRADEAAPRAVKVARKRPSRGEFQELPPGPTSLALRMPKRLKVRTSRHEYIWPAGQYRVWALYARGSRPWEDRDLCVIVSAPFTVDNPIPMRRVK